MIYTEAETEVLRYALTELIELLNSPTSADRAADAQKADSMIVVAQGLLNDLQPSQKRLARAIASLKEVQKHDDLIDDVANGNLNPQPPTGDDYNVILGHALNAIGHLCPPALTSAATAVSPHAR